MSAGYAFDWAAYWREQERNEEWWTWECAACGWSNRNHPTQGCARCDYVGEVDDL